MRLLVTGSAIRGLPVVTIGGGEDVAEVRDVIYSPDAGRVVGLTLNKRGFLAGRCREVLPAETIHAIGRDAVMVDDETSLILPEDAPADIGAPPSGRDVTGDESLRSSWSCLRRAQSWWPSRCRGRRPPERRSFPSGRRDSRRWGGSARLPLRRSRMRMAPRLRTERARSPRRSAVRQRAPSRPRRAATPAGSRRPG